VVAVQVLYPYSTVNIEGVFIGVLSPIKCSRKNKQNKYYDGNLLNAVKTVRFVSFEPKLQEQIEDAHKICYGVSLSNHTVNCSR